MKIGITGHQRLKDSTRWSWVRQEFDRLLSSVGSPVTGISSLAIGADQLFADAVLQSGGLLEVVIPFAEYDHTFSEGHDREEYLRLLDCASDREVLERHGSDNEAYLASGQRVVDRSDVLVAVWDGLPAVGLGGTGDVVNYAQLLKRKTIHLNPVTQEVRQL